jgi:hypothetical protein
MLTGPREEEYFDLGSVFYGQVRILDVYVQCPMYSKIHLAEVQSCLLRASKLHYKRRNFLLCSLCLDLCTNLTPVLSYTAHVRNIKGWKVIGTSVYKKIYDLFMTGSTTCL